MISGGWIFAGAVSIGALACLVGYRMSRRKLRGRQPVPISEIVNGLPESLRRDEASELLQVIGKSFRLQPEILRLDDPISTLTSADSWRLGEGQEELERWLKAKGVTALQGKPVTIRDLMISVLPFDAHSRQAAR